MEITPADLKARLLADRVLDNTGTVEIDGVGTITVRGMTRFEFMMLNKKFGEPGPEQERETLAMCMIDPAMTPDDVKQWQMASPAVEINMVAAEINRLSGIGKGADKEAYKSA